MHKDKLLRRSISLVLLVLVLCSCSSLSDLKKRKSPTYQSLVAAQSEVSNRCFTSSGTLELSSNTSILLSLPIQYTAVGDQQLQISIRPLGIMEVARIVITNEELLVVDRISKRYTHLALNSLSSKLYSSFLDVNPQVIKSLLLNTPFSNKHTGVKALEDLIFDESTTKGSIMFYDKEKKVELNYDLNNSLTEAHYVLDNKQSILARYSDFTSINGQGLFPKHLYFNIPTQSPRLNLTLRISQPEKYTGKDLKTTPPDGYKETSIMDILKAFETISSLLK